MISRGKTLGLIGTGRVGGRHRADLFERVGMRVLAYDPYANAESMRQFGIELVANVDAMIFLCGFSFDKLSADTRDATVD